MVNRNLGSRLLLMLGLALLLLVVQPLSAVVDPIPGIDTCLDCYKTWVTYPDGVRVAYYLCLDLSNGGWMECYECVNCNRCTAFWNCSLF